MSDNNKQTNRNQDIKEPFDIYSIAVFKDSSILAYLYKKTEKLVSALYLLSDFISDKEPIKWQMREAGIDLLSHSLSLSDKHLFIAKALKFLSLLEVSFVGGVISEMNYSILKQEFQNLIKDIELAEKKTDTNLVFPENFFEVSKGQDNKEGRSLSLVKGPSLLADNKGQIVSDRVVKDKSNRQEIILSLLKKNTELGIKDFVSAISNCSEKTIQRELATMISKGLIKKEGEKRWSKYLIKD